jgi:hypothetical protein
MFAYHIISTAADAMDQAMRNAMMLITVVFTVQLAPSTPLSLSVGGPPFPANKARTYYTVQVLAAPAENQDAFVQVYESLHDKRYLAYYGRELVRAGLDGGAEVYHEFHITGNVLSYALAHFDENCQVRRYSFRKLAIDELN